MSIPSDLCEACHVAPVWHQIESNDVEQPYLLCEQCSQRLPTCSLRPLEWFRLAAIHGPSQYYLHDDFYFDNGVAQAPREPVLFPELFPAPTLEQAKEDVELLIDYAMTQYFLTLKEDVWNSYQSGAFFALAEASASCLPFEEGFGRVVERLEMMTQKELHTGCLALDCFHSERTLDWLEDHVSSPITDSWGRVATLSQFSWARAATWLDAGRPLSLVALDALRACGHYDTPLLQKFAPKLLEPDTKEVMTAKLEQYAGRDPVPRVKQRVAAIIRLWDEILP